MPAPQPGRPGDIRTVPLTSIRPSPENDKLYRPVTPGDPDVQALARSIKEHGIKEPLVLTLDNYILSGHRRYAACKLAGVREVPVRREAVRRGPGGEPEDPRFLVLLREYNRQRVKSFDEIAREEALEIDPEEGYRLLLEHRRKQAEVSVETIALGGTRKRARISRAKEAMLDAIKVILERLRGFWPLTDRTIHYNLLNNPPLTHTSKPDSWYVNDLTSYKKLCELLTRARLEGHIPFSAITDETRPVDSWDVYRSVGPFVRKELGGLFKGYYRDLMQSQPNHLEILGEKLTLKGAIRPVAAEFCIPFTIGRGYCSLDPRKRMYDRYKASGKEKLVLLVLSDFDAEGEDIPGSFAMSMRDDFGVKKVELIKVALTHAQVDGAGLHPNPLKDQSSRAAKFRRKYGGDTYELEAVPPAQLQQWLRAAIDGVLDVNCFNREVDSETEEAGYLDTLRRRLSGLISDAVSEN